MVDMCQNHWDFPTYVGTVTFRTNSKKCPDSRDDCGYVTLPVSEIAGLYHGRNQIRDDDGDYEYKIELKNKTKLTVYHAYKASKLRKFIFNYEDFEDEDEQKRFNALPKVVQNHFSGRRC